MPASTDRLPWPSLRLYAAGSAVLMATAMWHALVASADPSWRARDQPADQAAPHLPERLSYLLAYMMHEPLCMWASMNMLLSVLCVLGVEGARAALGALRPAEVARVRDKLWSFAFYKFIFVFGVLNVQLMDEALVWCCWFAVLGALHALGQLARDRLEHVWTSRAGEGASRAAALAGSAAVCACGLMGAVWHAGPTEGRGARAFLAAECALAGLGAARALARHAAGASGGERHYYWQLAPELATLAVSATSAGAQVWVLRGPLSLPALVLVLQLRHTLHELHARLQRHKLYTQLTKHITHNYPLASPEEVDKNQDKCAICWEPMTEARRLPCGHLFHNGCLCRWVQQDASCPTCRRALAPPAPAPAPAGAPAHREHLLHFDGSRYVSWLPSFSVEVRRVGGGGGAGAEAAARHVHDMFPQYSVRELLEDLARTHDTQRTVDNILEGRLLTTTEPAPATPATPAATPAPRAPFPGSSSAGTSTSACLIEAFRADTEAGFGARPCDREASLRRRKEHLLQAARHVYLQRHAQQRTDD